LHVIHGNHHRSTLGEVRGQPVKTVSHGGWLAGWRAGPNFLGRYDRFPKGCCPLEQMLSLRSRRTGDDRDEQLPHDAEREVALEERAVARDHCHARLDGASPSRVEERGLAYAGRTFEDDRRPVPGKCSADRIVDRQELFVAF
jgi:hypothetical protein